jgi:uncharacterized membrane protein
MQILLLKENVMNTLMIVLRWLHIFSGVYWVGAGLTTTFIISPAVGATGDAGRQFIGHLMTKTKFSLSMMVAGITTVVAGTAMYMIDSGAKGWANSGTGITFGIGGTFGIIALVFGMMIPKMNGEIGKLGAQIQGKPTPEQAAQMQALRKRVTMISYINAVCLILATTLMATARFV